MVRILEFLFLKEKKERKRKKEKKRKGLDSHVAKGKKKLFITLGNEKR